MRSLALALLSAANPPTPSPASRQMPPPEAAAAPQAPAPEAAAPQAPVPETAAPQAPEPDDEVIKQVTRVVQEKTFLVAGTVLELDTRQPVDGADITFTGSGYVTQRKKRVVHDADVVILNIDLVRARHKHKPKPGSEP